MTRKYFLIIVPAVLVACIVVAVLIGTKSERLVPQRQVKSLGSAVVTFPGSNVTITPKDLQKMTDQEIANYAVLIYYTERFTMTQEETHYIGSRLLPRFFAKPQANTPGEKNGYTVVNE